MSKQHTPGPWAVKHHEDTDTYSIYVAGQEWNSWTVAALGYAKEDEANARLIAAAPDLLEALQYMLEVCPSINQQGKEAHLRAHAAIAKATGSKR